MINISLNIALEYVDVKYGKIRMRKRVSQNTHAHE